MPDKRIKHIGIIAGGNCAWAHERNLPAIEGYKKGLEILFTAPKWFFDKKAEIVSIFFYPIEKCKDEIEENFLMKEVKNKILEFAEQIEEKKWRILFSGDIEKLPGDLPEICNELIIRTKNFKKGTLNLYLNYNGREEILNAIRKMIKNKVEIEQVHEGMLRKNLYQGGFDDPEILIRTGGEKRLSGFLPWQAVDSEIIFLNKLWPEIEEGDVKALLV